MSVVRDGPNGAASLVCLPIWQYMYRIIDFHARPVHAERVVILDTNHSS
jgi:hypothetical protein